MKKLRRVYGNGLRNRCSHPGKGLRSLFDLTGRVAIITGGAGMLGVQHAEAIAEIGGIPVLLDLDAEHCREAAERIGGKFEVAALGMSGRHHR